MTTQHSFQNRRTNPRLFLANTCAWLALAVTTAAKAQTINPSIVDPTNTYAGKTYSQWASGFWQYYMSLPRPNNPFVFEPGYPVAPLSTGQSGPVWFLCGNYATGGTHLYTNAIPNGIALFMGITDIERDNANCPNPTSYTEALLRAQAKSSEDAARNMTCTIDGVPVTRLTNVLTTPYRVQSTLFNYSCPAVHNMLYDVFGETCYQNASGTPYTINGAVEDGVFLMIAPPSVGSHVIHSTCAFPSFSPPFAADFTQYLTVEPVALKVDASAQPGNLTLSWPQTPDNYAIQTSPSLNAPDWRPATLQVVLSNGIWQAAAPIGTNSQFFRLQQQ